MSTDWWGFIGLVLQEEGGLGGVSGGESVIG